MLKIIIIIIYGYTLTISLLVSQYYSKQWEKSNFQKRVYFLEKNELFVLSNVKTDSRGTV